MRIGIIGTGQIGGTLARRLSALGHQVFVANSRGPASLADLSRRGRRENCVGVPEIAFVPPWLAESGAHA